MDIEDFRSSLLASSPPAGISDYLKALWFDAKGNWDEAHRVIQDIPGGKAEKIHAYLHRKEGDEANAEYWYDKAGHKKPDLTLEKEWEDILQELL